MAAITAAMVKELRDKTGAGMMDCKKALAECDADVEKALDWLRQKGLSKAAKRADRATSEGVIASCPAADGKTSTIVEVMTETDFVARGEKFQEFAKAVAAEIAEKAPESVDVFQDRVPICLSSQKTAPHLPGINAGSSPSFTVYGMDIIWQKLSTTA